MKLPIAVLLLALATVAVAAESLRPGGSVVGAGYAFKPDPQDYYPAASRELQEEGIPTIKLCYDERGIPREVTLEKSSGFTRLDEAAVHYGNAVRIRPGLVDGRVQTGCVVVPVRFSAKKTEGPPDQRPELPLPPVEAPPILKDIPLPPPPPMRIPLAPPPSSDNVIPLSAPGYAFKPQVEDYYPSASRSLKEQGTTKIKLCYDVRGKPFQVTVDETSSYASLDEAAVRWGKAVRIAPGLVNGQPLPGCVVVPVKFSLEKPQEPQDPSEDILIVVPPVLVAPPPVPPRPPVRLTPLGG